MWCVLRVHWMQITHCAGWLAGCLAGYQLCIIGTDRTWSMVVVCDLFGFAHVARMSHNLDATSGCCSCCCFFMQINRKARRVSIKWSRKWHLLMIRCNIGQVVENWWHNVSAVQQWRWWSHGCWWLMMSDSWKSCKWTRAIAVKTKGIAFLN